eukprot:366302-Chlamydomonas_euryale.AAC.5
MVDGVGKSMQGLEGRWSIGLGIWCEDWGANGRWGIAADARIGESVHTAWRRQIRRQAAPPPPNTLWSITIR